MNKYILSAFLIALALSVGFVAGAKPDVTPQPAADVLPSRGHASVVIPNNAIEVAHGVFSLGQALDNGRIVEGYAYVHYKDDFAKSASIRAKPGASKCYAFLSAGAKWKTLEPYLFDPTNSKGLDAASLRTNLASDIIKWENAAGKNILGDEDLTGSVDRTATWTLNNKNEVYFGSIDEPSAIAITIVWGIWSGPLFMRQITEWDQIYDDVDFSWSASGEAGKMDFENIATHELGHSVGMDDLYNTECSQQTMYGYASLGETNKRTLESGDIKGVKALYS